MALSIDPKTFHDFHFKIAMSLRLQHATRRILEEFADIDVKAESVARIVQQNQYVEYMLMNEIRALGLKENTPTLAAAIALYGMSRARDFVCALQIIRAVSRRHPQLTKDGKLDFKPAEHLKFALKAEELATARRLEYVDAAYAAGLMFDVMIAVGRELFGDPDGFSDLANEVFRHGTRSAIIGLELAKALKSQAFSKFMFTGCLIHDIGKLALELLFPASAHDSYKAFREAIDAKPVSRGVRHFIETRRFGASHEYYSSQMAHYFPVFRSIEKPLLFHHEPYLAKSAGKDIVQFAEIMALASNMATNFRSPKDGNDPVLQTWRTPELKDAKIDARGLILVMHKVPTTA